MGLYLFLATVSHCVLDAFTDGELGVAFFAPFENSRYFFPVTPIAVSPIGGSFFSARGLSVVLNEVVWIWVPFSALRGCVATPPTCSGRVAMARYDSRPASFSGSQRTSRSSTS